MLLAKVVLQQQDMGSMQSFTILFLSLNSIEPIILILTLNTCDKRTHIVCCKNNLESHQGKAAKRKKSCWNSFSPQTCLGATASENEVMRKTVLIWWIFRKLEFYHFLWGISNEKVKVTLPDRNWKKSYLVISAILYQNNLPKDVSSLSKNQENCQNGGVFGVMET